jgi:2-polyprenyl-3-methyl-5-hydroxy-6-metoxy-1,4-benzoquinol methylase
MSYKKELFDKYHSIHGKIIDSNTEDKILFFNKYYKKYYKRYFPTNKNSKILEIGCNKGYLLNVLESEGYTNIHGLDLSHEDLEFAKLNTSTSTLNNIDAFEYCKNNIGTFDIIIIKAVLEHIDKDKIFSIIEHMKNSLSENGVLIIDVPNMDWLFATHERYMDFTHEVGFTKESISQVTLNFFNNVEVFTAGNIYNTAKGKILHYIAKKLVGFVFRALDPEGNATVWNDRNLIAVCKK